MDGDSDDLFDDVLLDTVQDKMDKVKKAKAEQDGGKALSKNNIRVKKNRGSKISSISNRLTR